MDSIRIQNFRSLVDTQEIALKYINILVGKNSAGKSSFLRIFPLFRQGIEENARTSLLLYGKYVDFGSFKDVKSNYISNHDDTINFEFQINSLSLEDPRSRLFNESTSNIKNIKFKIHFNVDKNDIVNVAELDISFFNNIIKMYFDPIKHTIVKLIINDDTLISSENKFGYMYYRDFCPEGIFYQEGKNIQGLHLYAKQKLYDLTKRTYHGKTSEDTIKWLIDTNYVLSDDETILKNLKNIAWQTKLRSLTVNSKDFKTIKNYIIAKKMETILRSINQYLIGIFSDVKYIAPVRATAERYYRMQDLAVTEVDPHGRNLPMFLGSLPQQKLEEFQNWTSTNFGFKTKIKKSEGHYSIAISHNDSYPDVNISDMGFGYSQILPILTQLWHSMSKNTPSRNKLNINSRIPKIIVIEQPELHLHPEFQAKFADVLVKIINFAKENDVELKLIIETHSQTLINRLGKNILNNEIDSDHINIIIFDKKNENEATQISFAKFDTDGLLENWPIGFFHPSSEF